MEKVFGSLKITWPKLIIIVNSTKLILEAPDGSRKVFDLTIERNSYQISEAPTG